MQTTLQAIEASLASTIDTYQLVKTSQGLTLPQFNQAIADLTRAIHNLLDAHRTAPNGQSEAAFQARQRIAGIWL